MDQNILSPVQGKLFMSPVQSDFGDFLRQTRCFWQQSPQIRLAFEQDLRADALTSKHLRQRQEHEQLARSLPLCGLGADAEPAACSVQLLQGRPRMPAELVFIFCMVRGWLGSVCSAGAVSFMRESLSLSCMLEEMGLRLPAPTTILENINAISAQTLEQVHRMQVRAIAAEGLDDFSRLYIDSTSVQASSSWPTDSKILYKLLERVLSIADEAAAMIVKGEREPVLGYKPQLARSGGGFVSALIVQEGNGSDSRALLPVVCQSMENTAMPLLEVSADDGYASKQGVQSVSELGVQRVSISGAKGKHLLGEELYRELITKEKETRLQPDENQNSEHTFTPLRKSSLFTSIL